jgi:hypothetical protein
MMSAAPVAMRRLPPKLGCDTDAIRAEFGAARAAGE